LEGLAVVVEGRGEGPGVRTQAASMKTPVDRPTIKRVDPKLRDGERMTVPFFMNTR